MPDRLRSAKPRSWLWRKPKNERSKTSVQPLVLAVRRARARARARARKAISVKSNMVKQVLAPRIGFRRTRTQSAAADGTQ